MYNVLYETLRSKRVEIVLKRNKNFYLIKLFLFKEELIIKYIFKFKNKFIKNNVNNRLIIKTKKTKNKIKFRKTNSRVKKLYHDLNFNNRYKRSSSALRKNSSIDFISYYKNQQQPVNRFKNIINQKTNFHSALQNKKEAITGRRFFSTVEKKLRYELAKAFRSPGHYSKAFFYKLYIDQIFKKRYQKFVMLIN